MSSEASSTNSNRRGSRLRVIHRNRLMRGAPNTSVALSAGTGLRHGLSPERRRPSLSLASTPYPPPMDIAPPSQIASPSNFPGSMFGPSQEDPISNFHLPLDRASPDGGNPSFGLVHATPATSDMQLDDDAGSLMSIAESDGSSTVVPPDGAFYGPGVTFNPGQGAFYPPGAVFNPPDALNVYYLNAIHLDNLRNAVHFLQHATILACDVLNAMTAQNPHCHRFPPA